VERREFSEADRFSIWHRAGGKCECVGCKACSILGCFRKFEFHQTAFLGLYGYQIDHIAGANDNSIANGRVLCIGCHKETPTYGVGLAGLVQLGPRSTLPPPLPPASVVAAGLLGGLFALGPAPAPPANRAPVAEGEAIWALIAAYMAVKK
jgi:hypothetical protein